MRTRPCPTAMPSSLPWGTGAGLGATGSVIRHAYRARG